MEKNKRPRRPAPRKRPRVVARRRPRPARAAALGVTLLAILFCDTLVRFFPVFGQLGMICWLVAFGWIVERAARELYGLGRQRAWLTLGSLAICALAVLAGAVLHHNIHPESARELTCLLDRWHDPDRGYRATCHLYYPAPQFYVPVLPTLLFGRTAFALNLGGALYFLAALPLFASGLHRLVKGPAQDRICAVLVALLMHSAFFVYSLFSFEQSNYPAAMAMMAVGLFAHYRASRKVEDLLLTGIPIFFSLYCYSPALALGAGGGAVYALLAANRKLDRETRLAAAGLVALVLVVGLHSWQARGDLRLLASQASASVAQKAHYYEARPWKLVKHVLLQTEGEAFHSYLLHPLFLAALGFSLWGLLGWEGQLAAVWVLITIAVAGMSGGFSLREVAASTFRFVVVGPLVLALLARLSARLPARWLRGTGGLALLVLVLATSVWFQARMVFNKARRRPTPLLQLLLTENVQGPLVLVTDKDPLDLDQVNGLLDQSRYFFRSAEIAFIDDNCGFKIPSANARVLRVLPRNHACRARETASAQRTTLIYGTPVIAGDLL